MVRAFISPSARAIAFKAQRFDFIGIRRTARSCISAFRQSRILV